MGFDEATYLAAFLISIEALVRLRWVASGNDVGNAYHYSPFAVQASTVFVVFFAISMLSTALFVWRCHKWSIFKSPTVQQFLPFLYMIDSLGALILGYNLYHENITGVMVAMTLLTNFFMLHILHGVFSGKGHNHMGEELTATLKSYIHHNSSFFFLDNKEVIVITTIWRAVSMSGHLAQALQRKQYITPGQLYDFNWALTHARNVLIVGILVLCYASEDIRQGFGRSAVGHVGYMLVRAGPVFRLGSVYVGDKPLWQSYSDSKRLSVMASGKHPFITIEVGSLVLLSLLFLSWRIYN